MSIRIEKQALYSPTTFYTVIFIIIAWSTIALIRYVISTKRPPGFPPGPPTFPGLGNLHQIPLERPFLKFHEWAKEYGDIVGLKLGPGNLVLLNTPRLVRELFDKRGSIYSGRPRNPIACQYVLGGGEDKHAFLFMQNDEILSRARTTIRSHLGPQGLDKVLPIQQAEASVLIQMILNKPDAFMDHISYWSLATPLLVIAGQKLEDRAPDFIHHYHDAQEKWLELLTPGSAPPIDIFPILKWIPEFMGATWKHKARVVRNHMHTFFASLYAVAKERQASRNERDPIFESLMEEILRDERAGKQFNELELAFLGGGVLDAGVDTTHATALAFVKILAAYPEVLKAAQIEIDRVCQESQSPSAKDINDLPYLNACLMEVFRWRGAAPNGLPHVLDKDDFFDGFRFPKGTVFLANAYTIHNDEDFYDTPFQFKPDRYLNNVLGAKHEQQVNDKGDSRRATYVFGAGRRICPGEGFARNSVLLAVAKIVWAFDVSAPAPLDLSNENGFKSGLVFCSAPFDVTFVLRSEAKRSVIQQDYSRAQKFLRQV